MKMEEDARQSPRKSKWDSDVRTSRDGIPFVGLTKGYVGNGR
jgi:hypothetical protein